MSSFALTLWAWSLTGSATALALVGFFSLLPSIFVSIFAGIIVKSPSETLRDRANRKYLMMLGDAVRGRTGNRFPILPLSYASCDFHRNALPLAVRYSVFFSFSSHAKLSVCVLGFLKDTYFPIETQGCTSAYSRHYTYPCLALPVNSG